MNNEWGTFTGRLLWAMKRAGRTNQSELARAVGVKPQSIQYLLRTEAGAQGSKYTPALAQQLGVSSRWLASGDGPPDQIDVLGPMPNRRPRRSTPSPAACGPGSPAPCG